MADLLWEFAEKRAALYFEGTLVSGSGRGYLKSDVSQTEVIDGRKVNIEGGYRIEVKSTIKKTITFKLSWLVKIIKESKLYNQHPAFFVLFGDKTGFAITPCNIIEQEILPSDNNTLNLDSPSKILSVDKFRNYKYIYIDSKVLIDSKLTKDLMYTWWVIEEDV